ncbi:MAG TPA: fluoride efflux transporter CrcB [Tenacibaculum sp.]|nr:fluoride efflux transporter CrcB [Tenacibaculum sp.]HBI41164.1 fluoride efflux transporter CrcB [Tenacibaculum sp.]
MKQFILVFLGGGIGSALRYSISKLLGNATNSIPYGTFVVNILGSFLIGLILGYAAKNQSLTHSQTLFLATGFCGGFTTFSSFAFENHAFLKSGDFLLFFTYTLSSLTLGCLAVFGAIFITKIV